MTEIAARYLSATPPLEGIEMVGVGVRLTATSICSRYALFGVPASRFDVLIEEGQPSFGWAVEVVSKSGRYDGRTRDRLTFCHRRGGMLLHSESGVCACSIVRRRQTTVSLVSEFGPVWSATYDTLRWQLDPAGGLIRIVGWHLTRYFKMLVVDHSATDLAGEIEAMNPNWRAMTLSQVNRLVSRHLYRLARDMGWRKLTLRERLRLGLDEASPQWQRESDLGVLYRRTGCGDFTHRSARGES